jgi:anti-anti-sigma factor
MTIELARQGDIVRARFDGILTFHDHAAAEILIADLGRALEQPGAADVRFDLAGVVALDSHWLGVFVRALRRVRESGARLVMERPQPEVRRLFAVVELDRLIEIAD